MKLFDCIRKLIFGIFILVHLVYHKISTSSLDGIGCGDLIIPEIWCYFYVNAPIYFFILLESSSSYTRFTGGKVELVISVLLRVFLNCSSNDRYCFSICFLPLYHFIPLNSYFFPCVLLEFLLLSSVKSTNKPSPAPNGAVHPNTQDAAPNAINFAFRFLFFYIDLLYFYKQYLYCQKTKLPQIFLKILIFYESLISILFLQLFFLLFVCYFYQLDLSPY